MPDGFPSFGGSTETGVVPAKTHAIDRLSFSYCIPRLSLSVKGSPRASCATTRERRRQSLRLRVHLTFIRNTFLIIGLLVLP